MENTTYHICSSVDRKKGEKVYSIFRKHSAYAYHVDNQGQRISNADWASNSRA